MTMKLDTTKAQTVGVDKDEPKKDYKWVIIAIAGVALLWYLSKEGKIKVPAGGKK